jgi:diguanylate cyclase (GGDEF)-like protein/PAS domain S-box-containing protein
MLISPNIKVAYFWRSVSVFGYCFFYGFWLYFAFLLNSPHEKSFSLRIKILIYIPSIIFLICNLAAEPSKVVIRKYNCWIDSAPPTIIENIYNMWFVAFCVTGIVIIFLHGKESKKNRVKKQTKIILITSIISFSLGTITDIILPTLGIIVFPSAIIMGSISLGGIYYAIYKYRMMSITPKFVSEYIFNAVNEPVFILGEDFLIKNCNAASLIITGYNYKELEQKTLATLINDINWDFNTVMKEGTVKNIEVDLKNKDKTCIAFELSGTVLYDEFKDILGIVILLHDISERKKIAELERTYALSLEASNLILKNQIRDRISAEEQLRHFVYYDSLTELPNRKKMLEHINELLANKNEQFAVLFIDLDGFKHINDKFGHQVGDNVLKTVAFRLKSLISTNSIISRIGGDEFIIILENLKSCSYVEEVATMINKCLRKHFTYNKNNIFIGASIGISIFPKHGDDSDTLIKNADLAMYEVKNNGGYGYAIYSSKMNTEVIDKLEMKIKFNNAMLNNEFITYYQPIIDLKSMKILNSEALIRWKQGDKIIPPVEFIPIAKNIGELVAIDNWMLENACIQCKKWHELGVKDFSVSLNTSYTQLKQPNFPQLVENILDAHSLSSQYLNLEITEDEAMEDPESIINVLSQLKNIGVKISLDDFGTGFSSLSYVNRLPIDTIKIDRSLIINLEKEGSKNILIVKSIIITAHSLNIKVVAEGIETEEQFNILKELQCDLIQGYLIGKPMDASNFEENFIK